MFCKIFQAFARAGLMVLLQSLHSIYQYNKIDLTVCGVKTIFKEWQMEFLIYHFVLYLKKGLMGCVRLKISSVCRKTGLYILRH